MPKRQKLRARLWLLAILVILGGANFLIFRFSFHQLNPYPITRGIAFGSSLWSAALLVAMLFRQGWARYVLIGLLCLTFVAVGMFVLMMNGQSVRSLPVPTQDALVGMGLYVLAMVPLSISRSLRKFLAPRTAGGM